MNWELENFDEVLEYVAEMVGDKFIKTMALVDSILETPEAYTGTQASMAAIKLASYRTKLGVAHQYWKLKAPQTKKPGDRLINYSLAVMYDSILELCNCLKLQARHEQTLTQ